MKFDGLFIFLLLSHPQTMNYEGFLNFLPLSNSKTMNLKSLPPPFVYVKFQKDEIKWYFYLSAFVRFQNHELNYGIFYLLSLLYFITMNLRYLHIFCLY
jgi:hypothetical protein